LSVYFEGFFGDHKKSCRNRFVLFKKIDFYYRKQTQNKF